MIRRHPSAGAIAAWFDGEGDASVGAHASGCPRCGRRLDDLRRVRALLRGEAPPAARVAQRSPTLVRRALVAAVAAAAVVLAGVWVPPVRSVMQAAGRLVTGHAGGGSGPGPAQGRQTEPGKSGRSGGPIAASTPPVPAASSHRPGSLRLGLIVNGSGPLAGEARDVVAAARSAVVAADAAGGVGGKPVELVLVSAEDAAAVARLARTVDVLVGGFGISSPSALGWLLPADPGIQGPGVVPAEMTPAAAGARLADDLHARGVNGPIGVVVGGGGDAAMAQGLASRAPTVTVQASPDGPCDEEVFRLASDRVQTLAVAGPPELVTRCAQAAARIGWHPPGGILVPPSAAYARIDLLPAAWGARTVLGLPWPTSSAPGAARFRAASGSSSYRALVTFAAVELAVEVARSRGAVTLRAVRDGGPWRSDLLDIQGGTNRLAFVVAARSGEWAAASSADARG